MVSYGSNVNSGTASGAMRGVRQSSDSEQFIQCGVQGGANTQSLICEAKDQVGRGLRCRVDEYISSEKVLYYRLLPAVRMVKDWSLISFTATESRCDSIFVLNNSVFIQ